jgi:hypothetical protein
VTYRGKEFAAKSHTVRTVMRRSHPIEQRHFLYAVLWVLALIVCRCAGNAFISAVPFWWFMLGLVVLWVVALAFNSVRRRDEDES